VTSAGVWEWPCLGVSTYVVPETWIISDPLMQQRPCFCPCTCTALPNISLENAAGMLLDLHEEVQR